MRRPWALVWLASLGLVASLPRLQPPSICQLIDRSQVHCADLPYNLTSFPNLAGDETSKLAIENLATFAPLINHQCFPQLKFFLCSVYFPMCNEKVTKPIGPCRPLCEAARNKCLPSLQHFGFEWPESLNCSKFPPENNNEEMCMPGQPDEAVTTLIGGEPMGEGGWKPYPGDDLNLQRGTMTSSPCPSETVRVNRSNKCVSLCNSTKGIQPEDAEATSKSLFVLSLISAVLTFVCVLAYCMKRYCLNSVPERSLLYCSLCFAANSIVTLFSLMYRDQIACMNYGQHSLFVDPGQQHALCSTVASLLYYTGTAGRLWWFVLCCSWKQHITQSSITEKYRVQVNIGAWLLPLGCVILALMARSIAADPLSGLCLVGADSHVMEGVFILLRELLLLLCCLALLIAGCINLPGSPPQGDSQAATSGIVGALYPIAALFFVVCQAQYLLSEPSKGLGLISFPEVSGWTAQWNIVSGARLLTDPLLGVIASAACVLQITFNLFRHIQRDVPDKARGVYQRGIPQAIPAYPPPRMPPPTAATSYTTGGRRLVSS